jgi:hypothetical protein
MNNFNALKNSFGYPHYALILPLKKNQQIAFDESTFLPVTSDEMSPDASGQITCVSYSTLNERNNLNT